ncbi:unnamed protein product, partial [Rotaria magnacalcarata]
ESALLRILKIEILSFPI